MDCRVKPGNDGNYIAAYIRRMCGRFTYRLTWPEIVRLYRLPLDVPARNLEPRYNVCPTDPIDAVIERDGKRELTPMRWGLVPSWWAKRVGRIAQRNPPHLRRAAGYAFG